MIPKEPQSLTLKLDGQRAPKLNKIFRTPASVAKNSFEFGAGIWWLRLEAQTAGVMEYGVLAVGD